MKHRPQTGRLKVLKGPSQRQLRAGELIRHALVEVLRAEELQDPDMAGISVTVAEVRMSPDLRQAQVYVEPLGASRLGDEKSAVVVAALNRHAKFLRGRLGRNIELKFTPDLKFIHDETFAEAQRIERLFLSPVVQRDIAPPSTEGEDQA